MVTGFSLSNGNDHPWSSVLPGAIFLNRTALVGFPVCVFPPQPFVKDNRPESVVQEAVIIMHSQKAKGTVQSKFFFLIYIEITLI